MKQGGPVEADQHYLAWFGTDFSRLRVVMARYWFVAFSQTMRDVARDLYVSARRVIARAESSFAGTRRVQVPVVAAPNLQLRGAQEAKTATDQQKARSRCRCKHQLWYGN